MDTKYKMGLATLAGIALGAAAVQGLHAQAKPPVYFVAEIEVTNPEAYGKEFASRAQAIIKSHGGKFLAIGGTAGANAKQILDLMVRHPSAPSSRSGTAWKNSRLGEMTRSTKSSERSATNTRNSAPLPLRVRRNKARPIYPNQEAAIHRRPFSSLYPGPLRFQLFGISVPSLLSKGAEDGDRSPSASWTVHSVAGDPATLRAGLDRAPQRGGTDSTTPIFHSHFSASRTYRSMSFSRSTQLANLQTLVLQRSLHRTDRQSCCRSRTPDRRGANGRTCILTPGRICPRGHPKNARLPGRCAIQGGSLAQGMGVQRAFALLARELMMASADARSPARQWCSASGQHTRARAAAKRRYGTLVGDGLSTGGAALQDYSGLAQDEASPFC